MIRIAISQPAFDAIAKTLPLGSVAYMSTVTTTKGMRGRRGSITGAS
jgi:hypothetical protein